MIGGLSDLLSSVSLDNDGGTLDYWITNPMGLRLSNGLLLICWGTENNGFKVASCTIDSNGQISVIQTITYVSAVACAASSMCWGICNVYGNVYACCYIDRTGAKQITVFTFTCDQFGNLSTTYLDIANIANAYDSITVRKGPPIIKVEGSNNIFAMAFCEDVGPEYGKVITFPINNDGTIGAVIDNWRFEDSVHCISQFIYLGGTVYAIQYMFPAGHQTIITFDIQTNGVLPAIDAVFGVTTDPQGTIDWLRLNYDREINSISDMIRVNGDLFISAVINTGGGGKADIRTFFMTADGQIEPYLYLWSLGLDDQYNPVFAILGNNEAGSGKLVALLMRSVWPSYDPAFLVFEVLNSGKIIQSFIYQGSIADAPDENDLQSFVNPNDTSGDLLIIAFLHYDDDLFGGAYCVRVDIYQVISQSNTLTAVTTLPATSIMR